MRYELCQWAIRIWVCFGWRSKFVAKKPLSQIPLRFVRYLESRRRIFVIITDVFSPLLSALVIAGVPQRSRRRAVLQGDLRPILPARRWELTIVGEAAGLAAQPLQQGWACQSGPPKRSDTRLLHVNMVPGSWKRGRPNKARAWNTFISILRR